MTDDKAALVERRAKKQQRAEAVVRDVIRSGGTDTWSHLSSHGHSFAVVWGCVSQGWLKAQGRYLYAVTDKGRALVDATTSTGAAEQAAIERAAELLRAEGWTVVAPRESLDAVPVPEVAVGQRWVPTKGKAKARTIVRFGASQWYPWAGETVIFLAVDGDELGKLRTLTPEGFKSWRQRNAARPVEAAP